MSIQVCKATNSSDHVAVSSPVVPQLANCSRVNNTSVSSNPHISLLTRCAIVVQKQLKNHLLIRLIFDFEFTLDRPIGATAELATNNEPHLSKYYLSGCLHVSTLVACRTPLCSSEITLLFTAQSNWDLWRSFQMSGMSSPYTEISEDEASEEGSYELEEKKRATVGKGNAIREVVEETQEALNVESDKEDRDEEDDEEPGADEYECISRLEACC